uniref:SFRICE_016972 n=1 Tax=Spodoptera frugiperda TaxID=7108 RepID=A0A2H1V8E4_SPOFR
MEYDALILGLVIYLLLVGILIIINEAFCKARCMKNAQIIQMEREMQDVELNERQPSKMDREPIILQPTKTSHHQRFR